MSKVKLKVTQNMELQSVSGMYDNVLDILRSMNRNMIFEEVGSNLDGACQDVIFSLKNHNIDFTYERIGNDHFFYMDCNLLNTEVVLVQALFAMNGTKFEFVNEKSLLQT